MDSMHCIQTIGCGFDNSLTPEEPKMPIFKVSTEYYSVENGFERLGMGRGRIFLENSKRTQK